MFLLAPLAGLAAIAVLSIADFPFVCPAIFFGFWFILFSLARWVEDGAAPSHVIATSYVGNDASKGIAMQRPLCPHPQKAWYSGGGDPNIAANYTCAVENK